MTFLYRYDTLEKLYKNNKSAHELYMFLLEDSNDGKVYYSWKDIFDRNMTRKRVRLDLHELHYENLLDFVEEAQGFSIKLVEEGDD